MRVVNFECEDRMEIIRKGWDGDGDVFIELIKEALG